MRLKKNNVYIVRIPTMVQEILNSLHIVSEGFLFTPGISTELFQQNCCKRAYLRGAFLAGGSVNNPEGSSYHLEIASMYEEHCQALVDLANEFHLNARCIERKKDSSYTLRKARKSLSCSASLVLIRPCSSLRMYELCEICVTPLTGLSIVRPPT